MDTRKAAQLAESDTALAAAAAAASGGGTSVAPLVAAIENLGVRLAEAMAPPTLPMDMLMAIHKGAIGQQADPIASLAATEKATGLAVGVGYSAEYVTACWRVLHGLPLLGAQPAASAAPAAPAAPVRRSRT